MSTTARVCLALGLAWAGGFGGIGPWWSTLGVLAAIAMGAAVLERGAATRGQPETSPPRARAAWLPGAGWVQLGALALLATLLARSLARVVIDAPASAWALAPCALGLAIALRHKKQKQT